MLFFPGNYQADAVQSWCPGGYSPRVNRTNYMAVDKERLVVEGGPRAGRLQDTIKAVERKSKEQV